LVETYATGARWPDFTKCHIAEYFNETLRFGALRPLTRNVGGVP
jgi:hypothetical protein